MVNKDFHSNTGTGHWQYSNKYASKMAVRWRVGVAPSSSNIEFSARDLRASIESFAPVACTEVARRSNSSRVAVLTAT